MHTPSPLPDTAIFFFSLHTTHLAHAFARTQKQIVMYPIVNLRRYRKDIHWYLRALEETVIRSLAKLGLKGERIEGLTGVWVEGRKVAVRVLKGQRVWSVILVSIYSTVDLRQGAGAERVLTGLLSYTFHPFYVTDFFPEGVVQRCKGIRSHVRYARQDGLGFSHRAGRPVFYCCIKHGECHRRIS